MQPTQKALEQQAHLLQTIIDNIPAYVFWRDRNGVYQGMNRLELDLFKAVPDIQYGDVIGKNLVELGKIINMSEASVDAVDQVDFHIMKTKQPQELEEPLHIDGANKVFLSRKVPILDTEGNVSGLLGVSFEITDRKLAEQKEKQLQEEVLEQHRKFNQKAAQVAHDIRSPLAALNVILQNLPEIPEAQRVILRNASNRIHDIANNLLEQYKTKAEGDALKVRPWLLAPLVESMVSEKRLPLEGVQIGLASHITSAGFAAFATLDGVEIKRVISNLINNAAEACVAGRGRVDITLDANESEVFLSIADNGCGIPPERLAKVLEAGVSFKAKGSGLGLAHAADSIKAWGGSLRLTSAVGTGTTVHIVLPRATAPRWFVSELCLNGGDTVGILDDDQSVHGAWAARLEKEAPGVSVTHFRQGKVWSEWLATYPTAQVFSDYEILGESETGLDWLEKMNVGSRGVLVTSHYEDPKIVQRCEAQGIRLLPKNLMAHAPIRYAHSDLDRLRYDVVLIDDDSLMHDTWKMVAGLRRKKVLHCLTVEAFEQHVETVAVETPIYIDSNLGGVKGEEYAKTLFNRGFKNLYLATGFDKSNFPEMPWIKAVVDKTPPF